MSRLLQDGSVMLEAFGVQAGYDAARVITAVRQQMASRGDEVDIESADLGLAAGEVKSGLRWILTLKKTEEVGLQVSEVSIGTPSAVLATALPKALAADGQAEIQPDGAAATQTAVKAVAEAQAQLVGTVTCIPRIFPT